MWLRGYLDSAGVDGEVFSGYITGTLSTLEGSSEAEIQESLLEVLQSCVVRGFYGFQVRTLCIPSLGGRGDLFISL